MCLYRCRNPFVHLNPEAFGLPCGCTDLVFECGCRCTEHSHIVCDGNAVVRHEENQ